MPSDGIMVDYINRHAPFNGQPTELSMSYPVPNSFRANYAVALQKLRIPGAKSKFCVLWVKMFERFLNAVPLAYEVDPPRCPKCRGVMRIISFIEDDEVIRKILKHCGVWKEQSLRPPPEEKPPLVAAEPSLDYGFFERTCA